MKIIIPEEIRHSPRLMSAAVRIGNLLEIELGDPITDDPVSAEFGIVPEASGRLGLDLSIADPTGAAAVKFPPEKLSDDEFLRNQVRDVWGDLLWARSRVYRARLREHLAALADEV